MKKRAAHYSNMLARRAQMAADKWAAQYWHDNPFGDAPKASRETYMRLWEEARRVSYPEIDAVEKDYGFAVDPAWLDDLALHTQIVVKESTLCYQHGRVLYAVLRSYIRDMKPENMSVIETGTARGFSTTVMARAMKDGGCSGKIVTFDLLPHDRKMLWNCIDDHDGAKTRRELLAPWNDLVDSYAMFLETDSRTGLRRLATGRVNFAFLDGAHTFRDVMDEFVVVAKRQQKGDVIVFDDYNTTDFPGLVQAVDEGCVQLGYSKTVIRSVGNRAYVIAKRER